MVAVGIAPVVHARGGAPGWNGNTGTTLKKKKIWLPSLNKIHFKRV